MKEMAEYFEIVFVCWAGGKRYGKKFLIQLL
jgi:hypothetical protein